MWTLWHNPGMTTPIPFTDDLLHDIKVSKFASIDKGPWQQVKDEWFVSEMMMMMTETLCCCQCMVHILNFSPLCFIYCLFPTVQMSIATVFGQFMVQMIKNNTDMSQGQTHNRGC